MEGIYEMATQRCVELDHDSVSTCPECVDYMHKLEMEAGMNTLEAELRTLREAYDLLEEQTEHYGVVDKWSWQKLVRIGRRILDEVYPEHLFTGASGDTGPLYIVALRDALAVLDQARSTDVDAG